MTNFFLKECCIIFYTINLSITGINFRYKFNLKFKYRDIFCHHKCYIHCFCNYDRPTRTGTVSETEQATAQATGELRFAYSLLEKLIQYTDRASINMKLLKPSSTFSRRSSFKTCTRDIKFFSKVI